MVLVCHADQPCIPTRLHPSLLAQAPQPSRRREQPSPGRPRESAPGQRSGNGGARGPGRREPADQKLWNQNPGLFSYTLSKAALEAATMLALCWPAHARGGRGAGPHAHQPPYSRKTSSKRCTGSRRWGAPAPRRMWPAPLFALNNQSPLTGTTLLVDGGQHLMRFERDFSPLMPWPSNPKPAPDPHPHGLRFDANLGILESERPPQPIQVDAELCLEHAAAAAPR